MAELKVTREYFNASVAPSLAAQVGVSKPAVGGTSRFAFFEDDSRFVVVAGRQEGAKVDLALAVALSYSAGKQLVLVLPREYAFVTLQRAAWLKSTRQPEVWIHDGATVSRASVPSPEDTVARLRERLGGLEPAAELAAAATPVHLGARNAGVHSLVEWATTHPQLDAGHRRNERSWHCLGQRVLSIRPSRDGAIIRAGIHYSDPAQAPAPIDLPADAALDPVAEAEIVTAVEDAVALRLSGVAPIGRFDEHWLQAVIRRDPSLVGVEQPALREVPAWRPGTNGDDPTGWGRGFIDLLGVDGHGDIRIVETKLAANADDLLVLQGLDYYVWASAYRDVLRQRLGASRHASLEIHYVIGANTGGSMKLSPHARIQASSLIDDVRWRFQTVYGWQQPPWSGTRPATRLLPVGSLP